MTASLDWIYHNSSNSYLFDTLPKVQQKLLVCIDENPGIRYRELLRMINSSNGVLSYHINRLEKMQLVNVERRSRMTRLFPRNISKEITGLMGFLRNQTSYEIIKLLHDRGPISQQEIIIYTRKAASTISWHMKKLMQDNIVCIKNKNNIYAEGIDAGIQTQHKKVNLYDLINRSIVNGLIYKTNDYIDSSINNYSEIMDSY
ncbi:MAG TPA: winged helix-turn-helix transcriptional regulator [Nitrososphaeraceae archaeon]|nr:winged helix-turn-helix transcriptional regulator [Nitrososphaeraceae archaeon]